MRPHVDGLMDAAATRKRLRFFLTETYIDSNVTAFGANFWTQNVSHTLDPC